MYAQQAGQVGREMAIPQTDLQSGQSALERPWNHNWPHDADWGPRIEWRDLALRWWDQWLKGKNTRIMDGPRLAVYMRNWYAPRVNMPDIPGEWRSEPTWPAQGLRLQTWYPQPDHSLSAAQSAQAVHQLKYIASTGVDASGPDIWWGELHTDQRPDDAFSLSYDSAPLQAKTSILGMPEVVLQASATAPQADWFARLSDVAPDGSVTMITGGGLNGAQRVSASDPSDLEPGKVYTLDFKMHFTSWVFRAGTRCGWRFRMPCGQ
jgi:putative CocE/NonD family hydrolase